MPRNDYNSSYTESNDTRYNGAPDGASRSTLDWEDGSADGYTMVPISATENYKERTRGSWRAVFIIAVAVLAASLIALSVIIFSYAQGQAKYSRLAEHADIAAAESPNTELTTLSVDWDALLAINPDTVAWLYIPGTTINYPVVKADDNEYYLTRDFDGDQGWLANFGAIFMDWRNNPDWKDNAYFIYGHHMNDGSMFAPLASFENQARFDECRTVYLLSPEGNFKLRSYSLVHCDANDPIVETRFDTATAMTAYIQDKINRSVVDCGSIPKASDIMKSFAFATCDSFSSGRYVLFCYVQETTVSDLYGNLGATVDVDGNTTGLVSDLIEEDGV